MNDFDKQLIILWEISFLIFFPVFEKVIVRNTNYITNNDRKIEKNLHENIKTGAIFVNYWKAFDTLNRRLLQAKPKALRLKPAALKLIENYLTSIYQLTYLSILQVVTKKLVMFIVFSLN